MGTWAAGLSHLFSTAYHKRLEDDLSSDTSGHFKRILVSLALVRAALTGNCSLPATGSAGGLEGQWLEKTEHHCLAGQCCWTLPSPHLGLSQEMSPLQLHDFCFQPQGNRDEGPENLTQAHEDAKVRPVLAVLLWALH